MSETIEKVAEAKTVAGMTGREALVFAVMATGGGGIGAGAPTIAQWVGGLPPSFVAALSGLGYLLLGLGAGKLVTKLLFGWMKGEEAWRAAIDRGSVAGALVFLGYVALYAACMLPLAASIWR